MTSAIELSSPWGKQPADAPRPMTGFVSTLTERQHAAALAYRGPDTHGDRQAANDNNMPPVVALTGAAGAGKSTAARYLVERHGYTLVKFAGPLKAMMRALGLNDNQIEGDEKELPCALLAGKTPRHAMQTLGTQWGRDCMGKDFWLGLWEHSALQLMDAGDRVVVDDCRFPNEAAAIRRMGGDIYQITGRGGIAGHHESERGIGLDPDVTIPNNGSVEYLHGLLDKQLARWG